MQHDLKLVKVNLDPRPAEITAISEEVGTQLGYLGAIAKEKKFAASLIVNCYNTHICGADVSNLSYYCRGETSDTLKKGMFALINLSAYIESHELYGSDFVEGLIERWDFRNKRSENE
ncbi:hypothetical protein DI392_00900 [Vibrio albus]|uniref:Uncharacterized protein n=1 Tax=Vibrio albus TaxID=2200953 RepID=A0A2U3BDK4_9VIBR|nr:hypothetical protein [Vibrio albus]PWI34871.1 hypothetical protein DI392_00900 [Vibrio albus]